MRTGEQVREFYNRFYEEKYDDINDRPKPVARTLPFYWNFLTLRWPLHGKALEIACGEGKLMRLVAPHVDEIHGLDICDVAIERATKYLDDVPNAVLHRSSDLAWCDDNEFDLIYEVTGFQHMPKEVARRYISQIPAKLKPGGAAFLQVIDDSRYDEIDQEGQEYTSSWSAEEFKSEIKRVSMDIVSYNIHDISYLLSGDDSLKNYYVVAERTS